MSTSRIAILDRKTGRATITPHFGTTAIGVVDRHLIWVTSLGSVMAAAVEASGTLGPEQLVAEDVLVRPGGAAKAAMSANGSLIYQRGVSVSQLVLVDEHGVRTPLGVGARAFGHPRMSPDGTRLAVSIARTGGSDIWVIDWKTKGLTKITSGGGSDDHVRGHRTARGFSIARSSRQARGSSGSRPAAAKRRPSSFRRGAMPTAA